MAYKLHYSDYVTPAGPPDPERWVGPPGPMGPPGPNPIVLGDTAPVSAPESSLWFDSTSLQLYVRYNDGNSTQWVPATNVAALSGDMPFLPLSGGTLNGNLAIGSGTGAPTLTLNGAVGQNTGVYWQTTGNMRWRLQTDASDNLGLYAYDGGGGFLDTGILFTQSNKTVTFNFQISTNNVNAPVAGGVAGTMFNASNTGPNAAQGQKFTYFSSAGGAGHDIGLTNIAIFDTVFIAGQTHGMESVWLVSQSPNDTTHNWGCNVGELNIVNRGLDRGWMRDRLAANPTGGLLVVAESVSFGGSGGGEGKNATYGYSTAPSANTNSTGFPAKFYNNFLIEPNSTVGQTGRAIYATGDITGTSSQYPYGPVQTDGTWLHGIDHTKAVYTDGAAETMLTGQALRWIVGPTTAPTSVATIGAFSLGGTAQLILTPPSGGAVYVGGGSGAQSLLFNGASGQNSGIGWQTSGTSRWSMTTDASNNLNIFGFNASGGFLGTMIAFWQGPLLVNVQAQLLASGGFGVFNSGPVTTKPTVTGSKGANAALASLLTALASYGMVLDSST